MCETSTDGGKGKDQASYMSSSPHSLSHDTGSGMAVTLNISDTIRGNSDAITITVRHSLTSIQACDFDRKVRGTIKRMDLKRVLLRVEVRVRVLKIVGFF